MTKDKVIAGVVGSVMVLTICGIVFAFWRASNQEPTIKTAVKSQSTTESPSSDTLLSVGDNTGIGGGIVAEGQQSEDITSGNSTNSSNTAKPKKEDFAEYEKYKDSKSALFGEIKYGTGAEAVVNKKLAIAYKGSLTNNTVFDQSRTDASGKIEPLVFVLGEHKVIPGMEQGVLGMKVGGKRRIIVPPSVGYGATGKDPIPPNAVMVFDVELLAVQ